MCEACGTVDMTANDRSACNESDGLLYSKPWRRVIDSNSRIGNRFKGRCARDTF